MTAWLLVAISLGTAPPNQGYTISAYHTAAECRAALDRYDSTTIKEGARVCVTIDPGTLLVLQSMSEMSQ